MKIEMELDKDVLEVDCVKEDMNSFGLS